MLGGGGLEGKGREVYKRDWWERKEEEEDKIMYQHTQRTQDACP